MHPLNNHVMPKTSSRGSHTRHYEPTWLRPCGVTVHHQLLLCFDLVITQCVQEKQLCNMLLIIGKTEKFDWYLFNQFISVKKHSEKCEICPQVRIQSTFTVKHKWWMNIFYVFTSSFLAKPFYLFLCHVSVNLFPVKHKK